jgi:Spy/CpxP family protein refolding chaperone
MNHCRLSSTRLLLAASLLSVASVPAFAQVGPAPGIPTLRFTGSPPAGFAAGFGGRGGAGGVSLDDLQQTELTRLDEATESQIDALGTARVALLEATFSTAPDSAALRRAVEAFAAAEGALALARADAFQRLQSSPARLQPALVPAIVQRYQTWVPPARPPMPTGTAANAQQAGRGSGVLAEMNRATGTIETPDYSVRSATLVDDFKWELLFVAPTSMGSWVPATLDDRGRLVVASHNSNQMYRLTLPRIGADEPLRVESIDLGLGFSQGILHAFDSLYVMVGDENRSDRRASGLYRVRDTNGDDTYDQVRVIRNLRGSGQHGTHGGMRVSSDGNSIFMINGNATITTEFTNSQIPYNWGEDTLVTRVGNNAPAAPEAWVARMNPDGTNWNLWAIGMRNPVDIALNKDGELFTYDADMEFDKGHPFYRPTNVAHLISGADMHFRNDPGTRKRPGYDLDGWQPTIYLGSGSPTGVEFGTGTKFPARYQDALYLSDWSYGNIYAVHMTPAGSTYDATAELFASGQPFGVADLVSNPVDGALYAVVGGNSQSAVYRFTYAGDANTAPTLPDTTEAAAREQRRALERFHGRQDPAAVAAVWPFLGSTDRGIRYAARLALEFQDPAQWRERALAEQDPRISIAAMVALARVSGRDDYHRTQDDPAPDKALQRRMLASLGRIDWHSLDYLEQLDLLRTYSLVFTRLGSPDQETASGLIAKFDPLLPASYRELNRELAEMLIYLEAPSAATKVMALLRSSPSFPYFPTLTQYLNPLMLPRGTPGAANGGNENFRLAMQEDQIQYAHLLRNLKAGWTKELREEYFRWFLMANDEYSGGNSFKSHLGSMRNEAAAALTEAESAEIREVLDIPYVFQAGGFGGGGGGGGGRGGGRAGGPGGQ